MCTTAVPEGGVRACLLPSVSCIRCAVHLVDPPLPLLLLQDRLEFRAKNLAESENMKMEVGSRVICCFAEGLTLLLHCNGSKGRMLLRVLYCEFGSSSHQSHLAT